MASCFLDRAGAERVWVWAWEARVGMANSINGVGCLGNAAPEGELRAPSISTTTITERKAEPQAAQNGNRHAGHDQAGQGVVQDQSADEIGVEGDRGDE